MPIGEIAALPAAVLAAAAGGGRGGREGRALARRLAERRHRAPLRRPCRGRAPRRGQGHRHRPLRGRRGHGHRRPAEAGRVGPGRARPRWSQRIRAGGDDPAEYVETSLRGLRARLRRLAAAIRDGFEPARTVEARQADCFSPRAARGQSALMALRIVTADERLADGEQQDHASRIFGPSGVGKTSLLKTLPPARDALPRSRGRHEVGAGLARATASRSAASRDARRHRLPDRRRRPGGRSERLLLRGALPAPRARPIPTSSELIAGEAHHLRRLHHRPDPPGDGLGEEAAGGLLREDRQARRPRRLRPARPRGDRAAEAPAARAGQDRDLRRHPREGHRRVQPRSPGSRRWRAARPAASCPASSTR